MITEQGGVTVYYTLHKTALSGRLDQIRIGETRNDHEGIETLQHFCRKSQSKREHKSRESLKDIPKTLGMMVWIRTQATRYRK
jgi:hypothetical protein